MAKKEFKLAEFLPQRQMSEAFINSFFLALSGGFQDAYTYNCRDEVFSNAQTGNVVLMSQHFMAGEVTAGLGYSILWKEGGTKGCVICCRFSRLRQECFLRKMFSTVTGMQSGFIGDREFCWQRL